jgi:hypothetical protein
MPRSSVKMLLERSQRASLMGKGQVHADPNTFGIVGGQHHGLGGFKHPARCHHVEHKAQDQQGQ